MVNLVKTRFLLSLEDLGLIVSSLPFVHIPKKAYNLKPINNSMTPRPLSGIPSLSFRNEYLSKRVHLGG